MPALYWCRGNRDNNRLGRRGLSLHQGYCSPTCRRRRNTYCNQEAGCVPRPLCCCTVCCPIRCRLFWPGLISPFSVCQLGLAIDAVANRNTLQFIFLAYAPLCSYYTRSYSNIIFSSLLNCVFVAYAAVQPSELAKALNPNGEPTLPADVTALTAITIATICIAQVAYVGLGWQIQREFGWKVYKFLGADRRIKQMYLYFQIFESLVKFDVLFWVGFSIQVCQFFSPT